MKTCIESNVKHNTNAAPATTAVTVTSTAITTKTITITAAERDRSSHQDNVGIKNLHAAPSCNDSLVPSILRHRCSTTSSLNPESDHTNGFMKEQSTDAYVTSNMKCMTMTRSPTATPTPPLATPSKPCKPKLKLLPIIPSSANAATSINNTPSNLKTINETNKNSDLSAQPDSNSASAVSPITNSPILVRNGHAFRHESDNAARYQDARDNTTSTSITENSPLLLLSTNADKTLPTTIVTTSTSFVDSQESLASHLSSPVSCSTSKSASSTGLYHTTNPTTTTTSTIISSIYATSSSSTTPTTTTPPSTPASTTATPATISPTKSSSISGLLESDLLQWQDMPQYLQFNPYVLKGYRPLQTFKGCLLSLFYWHNETINILTHAIPIVYILAIVPGLMPWENGYRFLSFCHVFGSVAPWCGSFVYHLFMNIESGETAYYTLLKLDMVGIWVTQSFGALPLVTATTYCFSQKWKWLIIASYCLMSLWGLYKALTASSPWQRRLCFALPFTMRSILTFLRTLGTVGGNHVALPHVYLQDAVSLVGGAIGAMRIPEKWFPGLVDFYLNSHNIMHVLVVVAVYSMHKATIKDFEWMSSTNCDVFAYGGSNITNTGDVNEAIFTANTEL